MAHIPPPPGFALDQPSTPPPPEGFSLDVPTTTPPAGFVLDQPKKESVGIGTRVLDVGRSFAASPLQTIGRGTQGIVELNRIAARGVDRAMSTVVPDAAMDVLRKPLPPELDLSGSIDATAQLLEKGGNVIAPPEERANLATDTAAGLGQVITQVAMSIVNPLLAVGGMVGEGAEQQDRRNIAAGETGTLKADLGVIAGGAITGTLEKLQLGRLTKASPYLGKLFEKLPASLKSKWVGKIADSLTAGAGEAIEETTEGFLHDVVEYATVNEDVEFMQDWEREAAAGGTTGFIFRGLINAVTGNRARRARVSTQPESPEQAIEPAQEAVKEISKVEKAFPKTHRLITENFPDAAKKAVRLVSRPRTAKGFSESPAGLEGMDRVNNAVTGGNIIFGENTSAHEGAINDLKMADRKWARKNFKKAYERGGVNAMPNEQLKAYAQAWAEIEDRVGAKAEELNVMVRDETKDSSGEFVHEGGKRPFKRSIENFFPRRLTQEASKAFKDKKGRIYDALVKSMRARGIPILGLDQDANTIEKASKYGHLESARIGELPDTVTTASGEVIQVQEKDPFKVIESYINGASQRLSLIEAFSDVDEDGNEISGQDSAKDVAERISESLAETHPDTQREWNAIWDALNGTSEKADAQSLINTGLATPLRVAENIARVAQLSTATVSQIGGGWLPIAVRGGMLNTVKAGIDYAANKVGASPKTRAELDMTRNMGAWDHYVMGHTYELEDITGLSQTIARKGLTATGFVASNRMLNQLGSMVALRDFVDAISLLRSKGDGGAIKKLWGRDKASVRRSLETNYEFTSEEIDSMINDGMDYSDMKTIQEKAKTDPEFQKAYRNMAQATQRMTANTNLFRESVANRPPWQSRKAARMMMAYMSYMRQMGNLLSDGLKQAKNGNLKPLTTLLVGGTMAGAAIKELKGLLFNKDDEPDEDAFEVLSTLVDYQLEAGVYGLAGTMAERAYWGIKLRRPVGVSIPLFDWWATNAVGTGKSLLEADGEEAYKALAKSTPIIRAIDAQLEGPLHESKKK